MIIDSSTDELPSITSPSTGTFSPGRTRSRSPIWTCSSGTSSSVPSAAHTSGRFRRQPQQGPDGGVGLAARAQFHHLADQHQRHDHRAGLEIYGDLSVASRKDGGKIRGNTVATQL